MSAIQEVTMPALSSTMETGKVVSWAKAEGDRVEKGETILVVESDKADMDVESFYSGTLAGIVVEAGASAAVGSAIAFIAESTDDIAEAKAKAEALRSAAPVAAPAAAAEAVAAKPASQGNGKSRPSSPTSATPASPSGRTIASPRAKRLARELNINLANVRGSGPNGRIVAADVEAVAKTAARPEAMTAPATAPETIPPVALGEVAPFTTLQQAVVRNMTASLSIPTFHVGYAIATDALNRLYARVKPKGVTVTALLAKAVAMTLEKHPLLNASYTEEGVHYKANINIAVAVAMEDGGLITPVLQNANHVDLYELSRQWKDLVDRARRKQLQPEEYSSGSFTISNLGMFGVSLFDAILPPGQGSILAIGGSQPTVVATSEGAIAVKPQMQVNITCDHRVIYGANAAAFLKDLAALLETQVETLAM
ncbi:dihydrolipoamide acetyltransferase family protein [Synechococcus sp. PCC 7336]|uniref:dihydrolipoamide acetyltransferase family protein n=1 Tax=Synechococcus sp. PCC 7336 TaxID=195250 RepID=UPI00037A6938|nr:dihydrolipoamide acetyltransferase family protein [Synechococcus sp. PCC 7336]